MCESRKGWWVDMVLTAYGVDCCWNMRSKMRICYYCFCCCCYYYSYCFCYYSSYSSFYFYNYFCCCYYCCYYYNYCCNPT